MHETATSMLRGSSEEELQDGEKPAGISGQLGLAEAGIEVVDDDVWLAALLGEGGEFAGGIDLEEFGDLVSDKNG